MQLHIGVKRHPTHKKSISPVEFFAPPIANTRQKPGQMPNVIKLRKKSHSEGASAPVGIPILRRRLPHQSADWFAMTANLMTLGKCPGFGQLYMGLIFFL